MAVKCYINRIEYPVVGEIEIIDHAAATSESNISVNVRGLPEPKAFDAVYLFGSDNRLMWGGVCGIPQSPTWVSIHTVPTYELTVSGMNNLLTRRFVNKSWVGVSLYDVVMDVYNNIIMGENIALGEISEVLKTLPKQKYIAPDMSAYDVLNEVAALVGATWNIQANPAVFLREYLGESSAPLQYYDCNGFTSPPISPFSFYDTPTFKPFTFSFVVPDDFLSISLPSTVYNIKKEVQSYDMRTSQTLKGATGVTDKQIETVVYKADSGFIEVSRPVASLPSIKVNGASASVGVNGIDSDSTTKQWLFTNNSTQIQANDKYPIPLVGGENIEVTYNGYFALRVTINNPQGIAQASERAGTSGLIESVDTDNRCGSASELIIRATNKLYAKATEEEKITAYVDGTEHCNPFTTWKINLPDFHIVGDYTVVERMVNIGTKTITKVTLKDKGFLTAYGTVFAKSYANSPTNVREDDIVVNANSTQDTVSVYKVAIVYTPLCFFCGDGQSLMYGGAFYAGY